VVRSRLVLTRERPQASGTHDLSHPCSTLAHSPSRVFHQRCGKNEPSSRSVIRSVAGSTPLLVPPALQDLTYVRAGRPRHAKLSVSMLNYQRCQAWCLRLRHAGDALGQWLSLSKLWIWPERVRATRAWLFMSEDADRYRRRAEECRRLADVARDPLIKRQLIETAEALEEAARDEAPD